MIDVRFSLPGDGDIKLGHGNDFCDSGKMCQQVRALVTMPAVWILIPEMHMVKGENGFLLFVI